MLAPRRRWNARLIGGSVVLLAALLIVLVLVSLGRGGDGAGGGSDRVFDPLSYDWDGNVGVTDPDAARQRRASTLYVKRDGQLVERYQMAADIVVKHASDVVIRETVLTDGRVRVESRDSAAARAIIEHSEIRSDNGNGVSGVAAIVRHSLIATGNDGITPTGGATGTPTLIEYSKIEGPGGRRGDRHHDGVQLWQGGNVTIRRNWISGWHNSAIIIKSDREMKPGDGPIRNVLIEENYLANPDGHYALYVRDGGKGRPQMVTVRNNAFGPVASGDKVSTGRNPGDQAVFVRSERDRRAAIAEQQGDPTVLERREQQLGMTDGRADARTWIVWYGNYHAQDGRELPPPGGWYDHEPQA